MTALGDSKDIVYMQGTWVILNIKLHILQTEVCQYIIDFNMHLTPMFQVTQKKLIVDIYGFPHIMNVAIVR